MIKKVGNWVFGSFFRTMGRFFFFLFFGFLIATIISKSNINIQWTDLLGIETIKAAEIVVPVEPTNYSLYYNSSGFDCVDNTCEYLYKNMYMLYSGNVMNSYTLTFSDFSTNNFDYIEFPFAIGTPDASSWNGNSIMYCSQWSESNGRYTCTSSNNQSQTYELNNIVNNLSFQFQVDYSDYSGVQSVCFIQSNQIICPTLRHNVSHLYVKVFARTNGVNTGTEVFKFFISRRVKPYISNNTSSAINSQTQEINNTLTDTNTTEANTTASNFFSNFTSQDNGGISSIITAPLSAISGLVNATCTQLTLPIPYLDNSELVLPCMSSIYTQHFGSLFTLYQTIIFGAVAYRMLVSLFLMIQGFKNPDDDKIEVVDL